MIRVCTYSKYILTKSHVREVIQRHMIHIICTRYEARNSGDQSAARYSKFQSRKVNEHHNRAQYGLVRKEAKVSSLY